ncbi:MAG: hypothetical protein D6679_14090 [Candidatus Hydrogenedentota bacterium]|nr:MAG: hypothetical protein D6679_14090 [Candidatus Hydrogenedentota bacterium]
MAIEVAFRIVGEGVYRLRFYFASKGERGTLVFIMDGESRKDATLPRTARWHKSPLLDAGEWSLKSGVHTVRLIGETSSPDGLGNVGEMWLLRRSQ